jgi:uncharacterized membrane protein YphA (DoxX/SURF4 family)
MKDATYLIDYGDLLARFCLSFVFVWSGVSKALNPAAGKAEVAALGLPDAGLFLSLTVACQIAGGLMVLLGFWARLGGLALLGFTVIGTLLAHGTRGLSGEKRFADTIKIVTEHAGGSGVAYAWETQLLGASKP